MGATGLPARLAYAALAAPLASAAGFYAGAALFGRILPLLNGVQQPEPGWAEFVFSLLLGLAAGFSAFLYALTLPRLRLRRRRGRTARIALSALVVLVIAVAAEAEGVPTPVTLALTLWFSLILTFTFIRYGVLDRARRRILRESERPAA
ncbi:MAG: hypothetical protein M3O02_06915 [Acidobacteriota bacterium]|nr:hypothetical protein [Acidobacteriota bacterium]